MELLSLRFITGVCSGLTSGKFKRKCPAKLSQRGAECGRLPRGLLQWHKRGRGGAVFMLLIFLEKLARAGFPDTNLAILSGGGAQVLSVTRDAAVLLG